MKPEHLTAGGGELRLWGCRSCQLCGRNAKNLLFAVCWLSLSKLGGRLPWTCRGPSHILQYTQSYSCCKWHSDDDDENCRVDLNAGFHFATDRFSPVVLLWYAVRWHTVYFAFPLNPTSIFHLFHFFRSIPYLETFCHSDFWWRCCKKKSLK